MKLKFTLCSLATAAAALLAVPGVASAAIPANGDYTLVNRATGKVIDSWSTSTNGDPARQYDKSWSLAQRWTLSSGSGYWKLMAYPGSMYLDSIGHTGNGSVCCLWANSGSNNQRWVIEDLGTGYYKIKCVANGLYLDNLGSTTNGDSQYFWAGGGSYNQQWAFVAVGATFYSDRAYGGAATQELAPGSYNTAALVAKGYTDNAADSVRIAWPNISALCYNSGDLTGTPVIFTDNSQTMPGMAGIMSSVKVQTGYPAGITYRTGGYFVEFKAGYLYGTYCLMHRGEWVQLKSSGTSKYTVRFETEYWVKSGAGINYPAVTVISGTNVLYGTSGQSDPGTCTGTPLPWEDYYNLNGEVKWTDVEGNCAMNAAIRDGGP